MHTLMKIDPLRRRLMFGSFGIPALAALAGCGGPLRKMPAAAASDDALALLRESAAAHGGAAFSEVNDVSVRYSGRWRAVVGKLQPELVDASYRGDSEERILLRDRTVAQAFTGPGGHKHVVRHAPPGGPGDVRVWYDDEETQDAARRAAAALVVDGYSLFLMGPMLLSQYWSADRVLRMELQGRRRIAMERRDYECDVLRMSVQPGLGFSPIEQIALFIDGRDRLMRRVRFGLDGLESTRGAIAEVDAFDHVTLHGIRWPSRFHERLLRPLPLPVHDWHMTGLDLNRGLTREDVDGDVFAGNAAAPAEPLTRDGP